LGAQTPLYPFQFHYDHFLEVGTIHWFDAGAMGLLSSEFWFAGINAVLERSVNALLWNRLRCPNWDEWLVFAGCTGAPLTNDLLS